VQGRADLVLQKKVHNLINNTAAYPTWWAGCLAQLVPLAARLALGTVAVPACQRTIELCYKVAVIRHHAARFLLVFAQRNRCASPMRRRAAADIVRLPVIGTTLLAGLEGVPISPASIARVLLYLAISASTALIALRIKCALCMLDVLPLYVVSIVGNRVRTVWWVRTCCNGPADNIPPAGTKVAGVKHGITMRIKPQPICDVLHRFAFNPDGHYVAFDNSGPKFQVVAKYHVVSYASYGRKLSMAFSASLNTRKIRSASKQQTVASA
jgi:hypothetical protein